MGEIASLSAAIVWAFASLIFAHLGKAGVQPFILNTLKGVIALAMMVVTISLLFGHVIPPQLTTNDALILALSGLVGITIGDTCFFFALAELGPRRTLLFASLTPPTTAILAFLFLSESFTFHMFMGMLLTLGGVVWVILEKKADEKKVKILSHLKVGIAFALVAMVCQSTGNILTKFSSEEISALGISIIRIAGSLIGLFTILVVKSSWKDLRQPFRSSKTILLIVLATTLGTFLGIWLLNAGLKYTTHTGSASTLASTSPIFILPLAAIFEKEKLSWRSVLGTLIAVCGIAVLFI